MGANSKMLAAQAFQRRLPLHGDRRHSSRLLRFRRSWRGLRVIGLRIHLTNIQLIDEAVQVAPRDAQSSRSLSFLPSALTQRANDQSPFELTELFFVRPRYRQALARWQDCSRKMPELDRLAVDQHDGAPDCVFEFSHIAGPSVFFQAAQR